MAPISWKRIELSGAPSTGVGQTQSPVIMEKNQQMIRYRGNLGEMSKSEKVSFQMVTERNSAIWWLNMFREWVSKSRDQTWGEFNSGIGIDGKLHVQLLNWNCFLNGIDKYGIRIEVFYKQLNPQINLPFFYLEIFLPWQSYLECKLVGLVIPSRYIKGTKSISNDWQSLLIQL